MPGLQRRFLRGRRRYVKRRGTRRRRYSRRYSRNSNYNSNKGTITGLYFANRKRLSKRSFKRTLWKGTEGDGHIRVINSQNLPATTPSNARQQNLTFSPFMPYKFWETEEQGVGWKGGSQVNHAPDNNIVIRGGITTISFTNVSTLPVRVRVWKCYVKDITTIPTPVDMAWDPSMVPDFHRFFRIFGYKESVLEPGDVMVLRHKLGVSRKDVSQLIDNVQQGTWMVGFSNPADNTSLNIRVQRAINMSYADTN